MKVSIYDLLFALSKKYSKKSKEYKEFGMKIIKSLNNGYLDKDIIEVLKTNNLKVLDKYSEEYKNADIYFNLLECNKVYYHNDLRIASDPVSIDFNYETGEIIKKEPEYFLEMKASYCIDDLYNYVKTKPCFDIANNNIKSCFGSLTWLVEHYPLEQILFMIDAANDIIEFNTLNKIKILDIQKYYNEAIEIMNRKINEETSIGVNEIVPRQR